ncbi:hypothetical protein G4B88_016636 [Cannabis sativa]|uniref:Uncharacterized protein n=1 Tax=Cannabis sativa TaxID=3483 RepID=A0A7J6H7R2_CANSA|nr:hypothetical protein G4B88_016636 [Cannabis sativa]
MHDHIHDLAVYVSGQSFLSYDSCEKDLHKLSSKTHHLSYDYFLNIKEIDFTKVKNLRSLISLPLSYLNEVRTEEPLLKKLWIWEEGDGARSAYNQILTSSKIENAQSEENVSTAEVSANSLEHHDEQLEL